RKYHWMQKFNIGDRVEFLNETGGGVVSKISGNLITVIDADGFEISLAETEFVRTDKSLEAAYSQYLLSLSDHSETNPDKGQKLSGKELPVIDLHIHELTDSEKDLSNYDMLRIQLNAFQQALNRYRKHRHRKIIFIHGVGEGVLKAELRKVLSRMDNCSFRDADYRKFGFGATEVTLWYN
ncbi:MAG: Smr/MutS family protein, partial [Cryomorphaceae bacterium]